MFKRSEEDKISRKPITVVFGDKNYEIKPLTILKARAWREKLSQSLGVLGLDFDALSSSEDMFHCLIGSLITAPDKLAELVFAYDPELPREEILEVATEEQIAAAFAGVMSIAFPFIEALKLALAVSKPLGTQASGRSTN